ncbi:MAG TPA: glycosyltransferase family 4 protein [Fimbriimonadaceae bacterium]|nr:glycosyltransferase family 4 protein [Fimbriimonadaceae bacterium]HRJ96291.1 glycosyltransferase family 4 protein [Fimbriimonadaceae bacterium]
MRPAIVVVVDYAHISGGAEKVALVSARALADRGYPVTVFAAAGPIDPNLLRKPEVNVVTVYERYSYHDLPRLARRTQGAWNKDSEAAFDRLLGATDPERTIVHFHSFRDQLTSSVFAPLRGTRHRVVLTVHDYGLACPISGFYDFRRQAICPLRGGSLACLCRNCILARPEFKWWYFWKHRLLVKRARVPDRVDRYLFVSEFARRHLVDYLPSATPQEVLDNPIEIERAPLREFPSGSRFTFLGRLTDEKDPLTFAVAAKQVGVTPVFVGSGPLEARIAEANPDSELTGWVDPMQVRGRLAEARALVFPSRWYEAQPLSVLEALATGLPCIVSDASAAREMVADGIDGRIFRAGDSEDLATKLRELSGDPVAERMGRAAYDRYWANPLTIERHIDRLEAIYGDMMGNG